MDFYKSVLNPNITQIQRIKENNIEEHENGMKQQHYTKVTILDTNKDDVNTNSDAHKGVINTNKDTKNFKSWWSSSETLSKKPLQIANDQLQTYY